MYTRYLYVESESMYSIDKLHIWTNSPQTTTSPPFPWGIGFNKTANKWAVISGLAFGPWFASVFFHVNIWREKKTFTFWEGFSLARCLTWLLILANDGLIFLITPHLGCREARGSCLMIDYFFKSLMTGLFLISVCLTWLRLQISVKCSMRLLIKTCN